MRANALCGATSQPQLVGADALYLRDRDFILAMLAKADDAQRTLTLTRMVVVLLVYGAHDYALDLVEAARAAEGGADSDLVDDLRLAITGSVIPVWPRRRRSVAGARRCNFSFCRSVDAAEMSAEPSLPGRPHRYFMPRIALPRAAGSGACIADPS